MRRLLLILLTLLLLITSIPVAYSEQSDWVTSYSDAGITVLYVPAKELEKHRDNYVGQIVCTTLYFSGESSSDNTINGTMEAGTVYDFQATFKNPKEYASLKDDDPFTVIGLVVPGSALDFGDVYLYDSHIVATDETAVHYSATITDTTALTSADNNALNIGRTLREVGMGASDVLGIPALTLKEDRNDYVGQAIYTVLFFDDVSGDSEILAKITPSGAFCYDATFDDPSEFEGLAENDIIVVAGIVGPSEFLDFGDVHLTNCHIIYRELDAQAIMAGFASDEFNGLGTTDPAQLGTPVPTEPVQAAAPTLLVTSTNESTSKPTPTPTSTPVPTATPVPTPTPTPRPADAGVLGETLTFGSYEQDGNTGNGTEPIEWRVIGTSGGKSLLLSEYSLDRQPYNTSRTDVTWATSSLRKWLNGPFLTAAFSTDEQKIIQSTTITTEDSYGTGSRWRADGGKDTNDKVFVLSVEEVESLRYDFSYLGFLNTIPTRYASSQGAYTDGSGSCWWWLRTPGASQSMAAISKDVQYQSIEIDDNGVVVDSPGTSVRPAIWVDTAALNAYLRSDRAAGNSEDSEPTHTTLKRGSKGNEVKTLQERLIALGYLAGSADGDFGGKTEAALIAYQKAAGLEATGIYDEHTAESFFADNAPSPTPEPLPTPEPTVDPKSVVLKRGDKSEDVRQLQLRLIALGYLVGSADGDFGAKTEAALIAYQDRAGLPETGECDYHTFQSITSSSAPVAPTTAPMSNPTAKPSNNDDDYSGGTTYIGNKNTKKFHYSWCSSVDDMKDKNKVSLSSREAAISKGYVPCKRCDP